MIHRASQEPNKVRWAANVQFAEQGTQIGHKNVIMVIP